MQSVMSPGQAVIGEVMLPGMFKFEASINCVHRDLYPMPFFGCDNHFSMFLMCMVSVHVVYCLHGIDKLKFCR